MKMKEKDGVYSFWQTPSTFALIFSISLFFSIIFVICLAIGDDFAYLFLIFIVLAIFSIVRFFSLRVHINSEKITIKGVFGVLTECRISEIKSVSIKTFPREGTFIVIKDGRLSEKQRGFEKKNCHIRFEYNDKTEKLVRSFWKGEIGSISDIEDHEYH